MNRKEFLSAVLPSTGKLLVAGYSRDKSIPARNVSVEDADKASAVADTIAAKNLDVYYFTGGLGKSGRRTSNNVVSKKELYVDVDCGVDKPYPGKKEAVTAISAFLAATGLPDPTIVFSGNGFQLHWIFTEAVSTVEWQAAAGNLLHLCNEHGLRADHTCTTDLARVMRMPDTVNHKNGKTAKVITPIVQYEFASLVALLPQRPASAPAAPSLPASFSGITKRPYVASKASSALRGNIEYSFEDLLNRSLQGTGCDFIKHAYENRSSLDEPSWRAALSQAHFGRDRDWAIHEISKDHPGYTPEATEQKAAALGTGPITCKSIENTDTGRPFCATCKYKEGISSPIHLGKSILRAATNTVVVEEKVDGFVSTEVVLPSVTYDIPALPYPYFRGANGGIYEEVFEAKSKDPSKESGKSEQLVYARDLYVFKRMLDPELGHVAWVRLHLPQDGVSEFIIPQSTIAAIDKFRDTLAKHGVTFYSPAQVARLQVYFMRCIEELQHADKANNMHGRFGWTATNSFILGDREYKPTGSSYSPPASALLDLASYMKPVGSIEPMKAIMEYYLQSGNEPLAFALFAGFGSIFVRREAQRGCVMSLVSKDTGTGKTTIMQVINSIWGNPDKLMIQAQDTALAVMHRIGVLSSIPACIDEITNMSPEETSTFLYNMSAGRERNRMSAKANIERHNATEFYNAIFTTSNASLIDKVKSLKLDPQGEMARVLEFTIPPHKLSHAAGRELFSPINSNYGVAGDMFLKFVMQNPDIVESSRVAAGVFMDQVFSFLGHERFHATSISTAMTAALVTKSMGLHNGDVSALFEAISGYYQVSRGALARKNFDGEAIVSSYVNECRNNLIAINDKANANGLPTVPLIEPKGPLHIRYEPDTDRLYLAKQPFQRWVNKDQVNFGELKKAMVRCGFPLTEVRKRLAKGTRIDFGSVDTFLIEQASKLLDPDASGNNSRS